MKEIERRATKFLTERGWNNLRPADLAKSISIEAGELLEIFQWNNQTRDEVRGDSAKLQMIRKELADIFLYCFYLSIHLEFDTKKIILEKLRAAEEKYLPKAVKGGQESGNDEGYKKIKREYRRKGE